MLAQTITRGLNQRLFTFHTQFTTLLLPLMATRVSAFSSAGSPNHAPLKRVGTHNGSFHCDEALGCFMIRLTDKFSNAEIVRSRDLQVRFLSSLSLFVSRENQGKSNPIRNKMKKVSIFIYLFICLICCLYDFYCEFHELNVYSVAQWSITFFKI